MTRGFFSDNWFSFLGCKSRRVLTSEFFFDNYFSFLECKSRRVLTFEFFFDNCCSFLVCKSRRVLTFDLFSVEGTKYQHRTMARTGHLSLSHHLIACHII
jgi:hypothetical protein